MTRTQIITITKILKDLGFEVSDAPEFIASIVRLVEANDREGLIARIAGSASSGDTLALADEILRRARG